MRDRLAKITASSLVVGVVLLAAFFAQRENRQRPTVVADSPPVIPSVALDAELVARGRQVYEALSCSRCHAVDGQGNPRSPLDFVGSRRPPEEIRRWITGTGAARTALPRSAVRAKEGLTSGLPDADLDALVEYLASLR